MSFEVPKPAATPFRLEDVSVLGGLFQTEHQATAKYLLDLSTDRLLAGFRANSGLEPKARIYGGWETGGLSGHSLGHYLTACAQEFARTRDERFRGKVDAIIAGLAECQKARGDGFLMAFRFNNGFDRQRLDKTWAEVAKGDIRTGGFDLNGMWSPWYVHHKVLAGLLDAHEYCRNKEALEVAKRFGDWAIGITKDLTDEQWQKMLACEYGGMGEALAELFHRSGDRRYLDLAEKFYDHRVLDPLAAGRDELAGNHSNTQIPKIIALARLYELTGKESDRHAAEFFWSTVTDNHTYAIGGNSNGEYLGPPRQLAERLSSNTCETCNTYNMLKLTRHLFEWNPQAKLMDYYEQAYFNHILASQDPETAGVTYFMPLASGSHREYSGRFDNFTCCHGTGMENHTKHGDAAYFHAGADVLWVNLFMPTELNWAEANVQLRQETDWPSSEKVTITVLKGGRTFDMRLRHPGWLTEPVPYRVNGKLVATSTQSGSYMSLRRRWKAGDRLEFSLPMRLREIPMPDKPTRVALAFGPIVLGADLGPATGPMPRTPVLVTDGQPVANWLRRVEGSDTEFAIEGAARPQPLRLRPFYTLRHNRYAVYFDKFTRSEWERQEAEFRADEARTKALASRTVDQVTIGEMQPERDHNLRSERNDVRSVNGRGYRTALAGGWFEFDLKIDPTRANALLITYWGNDRTHARFRLLIDGVELAKEDFEARPLNRWFDIEYSLAQASTQGKDHIRVRIEAEPSNSGPSVAAARILRPSA